MKIKDSLYICTRFRSTTPGEMAEWSNAVVLKTIVPTRYRGFESLSLRKLKEQSCEWLLFFLYIFENKVLMFVCIDLVVFNNDSLSKLFETLLSK